MLIRNADLNAIKAGEITLVYRRWRRPTVKTGGTLKTAVGVLAIEQVEKTRPEKITEGDARRAGYSNKETLLETLASRDGDLYRIAVAYAGEDPRLALRQKDDLSEAELAEIRRRLRRLDSSSPVGPWTHRTLSAIDRHPKVVAKELAKLLDFEKDRLKINIRKLKNLGLTISHKIGYELSPRGRAVLERPPGDA